MPNFSSGTANLESGSYDVTIGSRDFLRENGIVVPKDIECYMSGHEENGRTVVLVAINGKALWLIVNADRLSGMYTGNQRYKFYLSLYISFYLCLFAIIIVACTS